MCKEIKWIKIDEKLPKHNQNVIVAFKSKYVTVLYYNADTKTFNDDEFGLTEKLSEVDYWMEIPKHPES